MKKLLATVLVLGTAASLGACSSDRDYENNDYQHPYSQERTAGHEDKRVVRQRVVQQPAERVYRRAQVK